MRRVWTLAPLALGTAACASLSGLTELGMGKDGGTEGTSSTQGDDGPAGDSFAGSVDSGAAAETGTDSGVPMPDATRDGAVVSRVDAAADAAVDAAAICHAQCSGCCDTSGTCHGGRSGATCGSGGATCHDCATSGEVCSPGGACVAPPPDSGPPPMCVVSQCTNTCPALPLLEAPCCKPDQTCGCAAVLGLVLCN